MDFEHDLLTVDEAAAYLRVHPVSLRRMIRRGDIAAVRIGRLWRIEAASLKAERVPQTEPPEPEHGSVAWWMQLGQPRPQGDAPPDSGRGR